MDLNIIDQVVEKLTTIIYEENEEHLKRFILIQINWSKDYVFIEHSFLKDDEAIAVNQEKSFFTIEKENYESKYDFTQNLINDIKKFSLLHIEVSIKICDMELPRYNIMFETKSSNKFYDKVCEFTGLNRFRIFEVLLPKHNVEMYFFVLPETNFEKLIITSGFFNTAAVNTLYVKMTSASEKLENVSFIGKIGCTDHDILKRLVDDIVRILVAHLKNNEDSTDEIHSNEDVVDLTNIKEENQNEIDDTMFYEFNTSDIMETDYPLEHYYDPEIKGLSDGWDTRVDKNKYLYAATYDQESMTNYLNFYNVTNVESDEENHDGSNDLKIIECPKSDDELQIISVDSSANGECSTSSNYRRKNNKKDLAVPSSGTRMSLNRNKANKKIKSNLFSDEEIVKWERSKGSENMTKLMSNISKDYKSINSENLKDYKIPKKSYAGPTPRPSIHSNSKDSNSKWQEAQQKAMAYFQQRIDNLAPYDSPSGYRVAENNTPKSVSTFINSETYVIDDDDDEDDNNNTNNSNSSNPAKRKLLDANSTSPKYFKNRRSDHTLNDPSFSSSSFNKKSLNRR